MTSSFYPGTSNSSSVLVFDTSIFVKFLKTITVSSLAAASIQLFTNDTTPVLIPNAFTPLSIPDDYNTIARILELHFNISLSPSTGYTVIVSGLQDAAGNNLVPFTYSFITNPNTVITSPVSAEPIEIEDHSIKSATFTSFETITEANPEFYIYDTDPDAQNVLLDNAYNNGRVTIRFSRNPSGEYLNSRYFKVQQKTIARGAANRWQDVAGVLISLDSQKRAVYIDFPSQDATPVYNHLGSVYFLDGYKYRIKVSKDVGV